MSSKRKQERKKKRSTHIHKGEEATFFSLFFLFFCVGGQNTQLLHHPKNYYIKHKKEERKKKPKKKGLSLCVSESFLFFSFPLSHKWFGKRQTLYTWSKQSEDKKEAKALLMHLRIVLTLSKQFFIGSVLWEKQKSNFLPANLPVICLT